jgi:histidinol-phosphate aminotransferase
MLFKVPNHIETLSPYVPGKPIEELEREYGIQGAIKLASNESPLGPAPSAVKAITGALGQLNLYPEASRRSSCCLAPGRARSSSSSSAR